MGMMMDHRLVKVMGLANVWSFDRLMDTEEVRS